MNYEIINLIFTGGKNEFYYLLNSKILINTFN